MPGEESGLVKGENWKQGEHKKGDEEKAEKQRSNDIWCGKGKVYIGKTKCKNVLLKTKEDVARQNETKTSA